MWARSGCCRKAWAWVQAQGPCKRLGLVAAYLAPVRVAREHAVAIEAEILRGKQAAQSGEAG